MNVTALVPRRFQPPLEGDYRRFRTAQVLPFERLASAAGAIAISSTFAWDMQVDADAYPETLLIRGAMSVSLLIVFALTYTRLGDHHLFVQLVAVLTVFVGFAWILAILDDGFIIGVAAFTLSLVLLPLMSVTVWSILLFSVLAFVVPNLFLGLVASDLPDIAFFNLNVWIATAVFVAVVFWMMVDVGTRRLFVAERDLDAARERADTLLRNVLPVEIVERLKTSPQSVSERFESVTVLFADIVGFTSFAHTREPREVVELLNALFTRFDELVQHHGLEKIKTIGDGYMAAAGVPVPVSDHALRATNLGLSMLDAVRVFRNDRGVDWNLRVGIHSGPVVAGVIGKDKFAYDLWGDTVNVASRLESAGVPGQIHLSADSASQLPETFQVEERGSVQLRNRGELATFLLGWPQVATQAEVLLQEEGG